MSILPLLNWFDKQDLPSQIQESRPSVSLLLISWLPTTPAHIQIMHPLISSLGRKSDQVLCISMWDFRPKGRLIYIALSYYFFSIFTHFYFTEIDSIDMIISLATHRSINSSKKWNGGAKLQASRRTCTYTMSADFEISRSNLTHSHAPFEDRVIQRQVLSSAVKCKAIEDRCFLRRVGSGLLLA